MFDFGVTWAAAAALPKQVSLKAKQSLKCPVTEKKQRQACVSSRPKLTLL